MHSQSVPGGNISYVYHTTQAQEWVANQASTKLECLGSFIQGAGNMHKFNIGLSGVRALPLAVGRNKGGHYFHYKNITALFWEYNRALPAI